MMARETWLNADEAIEQGFADSKMFENDNMQIVASNTQVLSKDVLNRVTALVSKTPEVNIDIDAIANKVIEKINMKEKESEIDVADSKVSANGFSRFLFNTKIGGHKMTINLSETFANAKTNLLMQ